MSLSRECLPLLSVSVEDDANHRLSGIALVPTQACKDKLADHHLVFRPSDGGLRIFFQKNPEAADPLLGRIDERTRFSFALVPSRNLLDDYKPDLTPDTGRQLYLHNLTPSGQIQTKNTLTVGTLVAEADAIRICEPIFTVPVDMTGGPTKIRIHDRFDPPTIIREIPVAPEGGGGRALTKVDLSDLPSGPYLMDTDAAGAVARAIYVDRELAARPALGLVDLYQEDAQDSVAPGGLNYLIRFKPR